MRFIDLYEIEQAQNNNTHKAYFNGNPVQYLLLRVDAIWNSKTVVAFNANVIKRLQLESNKKTTTFDFNSKCYKTMLIC